MQGSYDLDATVGWHWSTKLSLADCKLACEARSDDEVRWGFFRLEHLFAGVGRLGLPVHLLGRASRRHSNETKFFVQSTLAVSPAKQPNIRGIHRTLVLRPPPLQLHDEGSHVSDNGPWPAFREALFASLVSPVNLRK